MRTISAPRRSRVNARRSTLLDFEYSLEAYCYDAAKWGTGTSTVRTPYDQSFAILTERVEVIGDPQPSVTRPPRHDDETPGPSIFRQALQDVSLPDLTLPGLYVGRSQLKRVSFRGSDLQLATFNWSDLFDCDFSAADLSGADLRACRFVRCQFRSANLAGADLRGSSFQECDFVDAVMAAAKLHRRPRVLGFLKLGSDQTGLPLSSAQQREIDWSAEVPAPGGG